MLPAYVIHHKSQPERDVLVERIIELTGAKVVEACMISYNPTLGCRMSHRKVAQLAKEEHPESAYLVFENDCEIIVPNFLNLLIKHDVDLLFFGITGSCFHHKPFYHHSLWGTHAVKISSKARDLFLEKEEVFVSIFYFNLKS